MRFLAVLTAFLVSGTAAFSTTIAWDGTQLACDSQTTSGHTKIKSPVAKIAYSPTRHATIAAAGDVAFTAPLKKYFLNTDKPLDEYKPSSLAMAHAEEWVILVINDDGSAFFYNHSMQDPTPVPPPFSFGTGEDFALAIMTYGGPAEDAIKVAEILDLYTGGKIVVLQAPRVPEARK
jgi:ATP-dependent protease HslVU (ClpYQ) peptidase subunit